MCVKDLPLCRIVYEYSGYALVVSDPSVLGVIDNATNAYLDIIKHDVKPDDQSKIRRMILTWAMDMVLNQGVYETPLQPGHWEEYRVTWRMPRYTFKAILHIVRRPEAPGLDASAQQNPNTK